MKKLVLINNLIGDDLLRIKKYLHDNFSRCFFNIFCLTKINKYDMYKLTN